MTPIAPGARIYKHPHPPTFASVVARPEPPKCNRGACQAALVRPGRRMSIWFNHGNAELYCRRCAWLINEYTPGLCEDLVQETAPLTNDERAHLTLLLNFVPNEPELTHVLRALDERNWKRTTHLIAAVYCHMMSTGGDDYWTDRAYSYARAGGYDPVRLGLR